MEIGVTIKKIGAVFTEAWFPPTCGGCGREGAWLCQLCTLRFQPVFDRCFGCRRPSFDGRFCFSCAGEWPLDGVSAAGSYTEEVVRRAIHAMKYQYVQTLCAALAPLLRHAVQVHLSLTAAPVLVPLPLADRRLRWRGFNQAALLAQQVGQDMKIPYADALIRVRHTIAQAELPHEERRANVMGVFQAKNSLLLQARDVILIDDVATTGSTLRAAAETCRAAGARTVFASVLAIG